MRRHQKKKKYIPALLLLTFILRIEFSYAKNGKWKPGNENDRRFPIDRTLQIEKDIPIKRTLKNDRILPIDRSLQNDRRIPIDRSLQNDRRIPIDTSLQNDRRRFSIDRSLQNARRIAIDRSLQNDRRISIDTSLQNDRRRFPIDRSLQNDRRIPIDRRIQNNFKVQNTRRISDEHNIQKMLNGRSLRRIGYEKKLWAANSQPILLNDHYDNHRKLNDHNDKIRELDDHKTQDDARDPEGGGDHDRERGLDDRETDKGRPGDPVVNDDPKSNDTDPNGDQGQEPEYIEHEEGGFDTTAMPTVPDDPDEGFWTKFFKKMAELMENIEAYAPSDALKMNVRMCYCIATTYISARQDFKRYYERRSLYENNIEFEVGYLVSEIISKYQRMLELYNMAVDYYFSRITKQHMSPNYMLYMYTNVLEMGTVIAHLCSMLTEIEDKYVYLPAPWSGFSDYHHLLMEKTNDDPDVKMAREAMKYDRIMSKILKRQKKKKKKTVREVNFDTVVTTPVRKPKHRSWPIVYGWSIEYYW